MSQDPLESLDPELRAAISDMLGGFIALDDIAAARLGAAEMMAAAKVPPGLLDRIGVEGRVVPGPEGAPDVAVRVYRPLGSKRKLPALLWMHGGGYVLGSIEYEDSTCARFADEAECVVVACEYRLAPEHPFPAPLEDCYAALRWMATEAGALGIDVARIAVGGASAGGGLAAGLALLARDRGEVELIFQLLVFPMIDDRNVAPACDALPDSLFWTRGNNLVAWRSYLACEPGGAEISCYASASRAEELDGLPPAYLTVGDLDLFVQEDIDYARRLIRAGVPAELHVYPGACHGFDMLVPDAELSRRFVADQVRALKRALHLGV